MKDNEFSVYELYMLNKKQNYITDLENLKLKANEYITFKEMVKIVARDLGYNWNEIVSNMPSDLYEAFGYDSRYSYLSGVKNLSDCKHPAIKAAMQTLNKFQLNPYFMDISVDIDRLERITGNRRVLVSKVRDIIESINKVGNVTSSNIIINSKNEIIDGQHRACALIILGQPFTIATESSGNITTVQCMNASANAWNLINHIESRAELGIEAFVYLKDLLARYKHIGGVNLILNCATKRFNVDKKHVQNEDLMSSLITDQSYIDARYALDYLTKTYCEYFKTHPNYYTLHGGVRNDHLTSLLALMCFLHNIDMDIIMDIIYKGNVLQKNNTTKLCLQRDKDLPSWAYLIFKEYKARVDGKKVSPRDCEVYATNMRAKLFDLAGYKLK